jgi:hypothetical protein
MISKMVSKMTSSSDSLMYLVSLEESQHVPESCLIPVLSCVIVVSCSDAATYIQKYSSRCRICNTNFRDRKSTRVGITDEDPYFVLFAFQNPDLFMLSLHTAIT